MTSLHTLTPKIKKVSKIRRGQGDGSGYGSFSGRGCNGQNARAGGGVRIGFEGGQSGILAKMPKLRGFKNPFRAYTQVVSLGVLEELFKDGEVVNIQSLFEKGLVAPKAGKIKVLNNGDITKKLEISPEILVSKGALVKIEKAGGKLIAAQSVEKKSEK